MIAGSATFLSTVFGCWQASQVSDLASRMEEQENWPRVGFANFCAVTGVGVGVWEAVLAGNRFGLIGAALSLAPVVYNAFRGSDVHLEDRPLAYAASAQLAFE